MMMMIPTTKKGDENAAKSQSASGSDCESVCASESQSAAPADAERPWYLLVTCCWLVHNSTIHQRTANETAGCVANSWDCWEGGAAFVCTSPVRWEKCDFSLLWTNFTRDFCLLSTFFLVRTFDTHTHTLQSNKHCMQIKILLELDFFSISMTMYTLQWGLEWFLCPYFDISGWELWHRLTSKWWQEIQR